VASLRRQHHELNTEKESGIFYLRPHIEFKIHPSSVIAFEYFCFRSPEMVSELDAFIEISKGKTKFLDVGALHGLFTMVFHKTRKQANTISVDPSPIAFSRLLYNLHSNNLSVESAHEIALSDKAMKLKMFYEWEHLVATETSENNQLLVDTMRGDDLCEQCGFEPDIIKIDVEGHEWKVIQGLDLTIKKNLPVIFLELHPERIKKERDSLAVIRKYFKDLGYNAYSLKNELLDIENTENERIILKINKN
jgi:FkbM family methyltransferase